MSTTRNETRYDAPDGQPLIEIVREFDAPRELVCQAHVDPDLIVQWLGPRRLTMKVERYDIERGGGYAYTHIDTDGTEYAFWGAVHDAREPELIVQTFGFEGAGDAASLDRMVAGGPRRRTHAAHASPRSCPRRRDPRRDAAQRHEGGRRPGLRAARRAPRR